MDPVVEPSDVRIDLEIQVAARPGVVFEHWTDPTELVEWFAPKVNVELRLGGPYEMLFMPDGEPGQQGGEGCQILAWLPGELLTFSWNAPPHLPDERGQNTFVVVRMDPGEGGTWIRLTHTGFGEGGRWDEVVEYFEDAWKSVLTSLKEHLEGAPPGEGCCKKVEPPVV